MQGFHRSKFSSFLNGDLPFLSGSWRRGFTIIELQIGIAIGIIGILIFSSGLLAAAKSKSFIQSTMVRNELAVLVRSSISDRAAMRITIQNNPELYAMVHNDYSLIPGGFLVSNQPYPVSIYDSSGTVISGTLQHPVYFTSEGNSCTTIGTGNCLITIKSSLMFQGLPQNNSPDRLIPMGQYPVGPDINIDFIQINYSISFAETATEIGRRDINGSVIVNFEDITP